MVLKELLLHTGGHNSLVDLPTASLRASHTIRLVAASCDVVVHHDDYGGDRSWES